VLGQNRQAPLTRKHVKHAVEMFLCYYATLAPVGESNRTKRPGQRRGPGQQI
jgi:hypothetical protein